MFRNRRSIGFLCGVVVAATCGLAVSRSASTPRGLVTRDTLLSSFDSDMRAVVYRWAPDDPRPEAERRRALFDFVYQTYESSAWIPQSLFDSNLVTQAVVGDVDTIVRDRAGLVLWRDNAVVPAFGMAPDLSPGQPLKWTVNCLTCHTADIDGVTYFGAGTKVFDDKWLGDSLKVLDERAVAAPAAGHVSRQCAGRRREPDPQQPPSRQDRFAHPGPLDRVCRVARRALHAAARRQDASHRGGRARGHEDTAAVAHRGQDSGRPLVLGRQFSRIGPDDGVVDGARKGPAVRRAGGLRPAEDQRGVRLGHPPLEAAAVSVRDRSGARRRGQGPLLLAGDGMRALPRRVRRTGERPLARRPQRRRHRRCPARRSCQTGSSPRSTAARSRRRGTWSRAAATRPRR